MKYLTIILLLTYSLSFSQEKEVRDMTSYPNPSIVVNWGFNSWMEVPDEMKVSPLSMGVDIFGMHTLLGKDNFMSLAVGGGISVQNIKSNTYYVNGDSSYFQEIPKELSYSKSKLTTVFFDVPIEIRLRSRPKPRDKAGIVRKRNIRFAFGFKVGYNFQRYIKYDGEDYRANNYGNPIKFKEYHLKNISPFRYGIYGRVGFGKFSLFGYYALSPFFINKKGPVLRPFSIGLSIHV